MMSVTQHDAMERSIIRKADAAQSETPPRECKMTSDESLKRELEVNADAIVDRYCHEYPVALHSDIIVHEEIKTFASRYARLAFDDLSMDYSRADLFSGEVSEPPFCGFYWIGVSSAV